MKHISWEFGVLDESLREELKLRIPNSKSIKTLCNSKVTKDGIDNESPSCPRCIRNFNELEKIALKTLG